MNSIYNLSKIEIIEFLVNNGYKKYNANQVFEFLYNKKINNFNEMHNVKNDIIALLENNFKLLNIKKIKKETAKDVFKFLFELDDKEKIESVLMKQSYGNSLCISTQVGCNMGCSFCESGRQKKVRDLKVSEMISQILLVEKKTNLKISHVVLMGIGEPFDNYENVLKFIKLLNDPKGLEIGARHITLSTCGLIPKIKEFSNFDLQVNLAISLHAPNNKLRDELMPINKVYPIEKLMDEIKNYIEKTNRRVTFEYLMIKGINDKEKNAFELIKLLKGINCYVNLIPYNETSAIDYKRSNKEKIMNFYDILKKNGINCTIRREFGTKISAACGQLRGNRGEE